MKQKTLIISIAATIAAGTIIYLLVNQKNKAARQLIDVADAGYETAHDVLYPLRNTGWRWKKI